MRKHLVVLVALIAVLAVAVPSFALEFKYGGLWRLRVQHSNNISDGWDTRDGGFFDDDENWIDQRLRMYFTFVASENLQVVTKWEADTLWGQRASGGDVGADERILEMKNAYVDFLIPCTPVRAKMGVQGIALLSGWIVDDDFSAAMFSTNFEPFSITAGYIAGMNEDVIDTVDNIDDFVIALNYANGPFKGSLIGLFQSGHDTGVSIDPGLFGNGALFGSPYSPLAVLVPNPPGWWSTDNNFFDLGLNLEYKTDVWSVYFNGVKNFGSFDSDIPGLDTDYTGWMIEAYGNYYVDAFTFTLGGFYTSGEDIQDFLADGDMSNYFRYPAGVSHYWSEIMGLGTLDVNVGGAGCVDRNRWSLGYASADHPSNIWMVNFGAAWQALEGTKLTLNYYYIGTSGDVASEGFPVPGGWVVTDTDNSIGHELDFYLDQKVVDGLMLRIVGAYLFANDGYTTLPDDDDAYEIGARLQWAF